jgi:hypothetical protein
MESRFEYHDVFVTRREWFATGGSLFEVELAQENRSRG